MTHEVSRREFVTDAGKLALGAMIVPRHVLGGVGYQAPSDTLNVAVIGFGGMGSSNALVLAQTENIVAICDVDFGYAEHKMAEHLHDRDGSTLPDGRKLQDQFAKAARY